MPRIRNWKDLKFYRPSADVTYQHIDSLFDDNVVDWELIKTHWQDLLQVVISIQEGKVLPSMLLRKLTTYSRKNRLYQAFHALGTVVRTAFLLTFISDVKLREVIHRSTNKAEEYHNFEDWITFASGGIIRERAYAEQEKRIKYTGIIANCIMLGDKWEFSKFHLSSTTDSYGPAKRRCGYLSRLVFGSLSRKRSIRRTPPSVLT